MKLKQMRLMTRKMKLAILGGLLIIIISAVLVIAVSTTGLLGGTVDNSGQLSPAGAVGSPLVVVRHNSLWNSTIDGEHNDPSQFTIIDEIKWATLYGAGSNTNSFKALNNSAIALWNNGSETLYPAWQVIGLPTGYTLNCYVAVRIIGTEPPLLSWENGYLWQQNDYKAFTLKPKDFIQSDYYRMVFVLAASETAIPGSMNFQIQFAYMTTLT